MDLTSLALPRDDRGQATVLMVGVAVVTVAAMVALAIFGQAIVHRARARNAADAVALAAATTSSAADELVHWYGERGIVVERDGSQTTARSGPSRAAAWASTAPALTQPAPALVAIIARAEQLLDTAFASVQWHATDVTLAASEAAMLRQVAPDMGLCEQLVAESDPHEVVFELC